MAAGNVAKEYAWVAGELDKLLESHGYRRNGSLYQAVEGNNDTIVFFCHFGVECVLLSHLLNISPMLLWHGTMAAPTSVTTVVTEEHDFLWGPVPPLRQRGAPGLCRPLLRTLGERGGADGLKPLCCRNIFEK